MANTRIKKSVGFDVDKALKIINDKNPELREQTRQTLAAKFGKKNTQLFSDWKAGYVPEAFEVLHHLHKEAGVDIIALMDELTPETVENGK